jgi:outer membrane protein assembly factor BamB
MCFEEATGKFLWQTVHDVPADEAVKEGLVQGICSTPVVEGNRLLGFSLKNKGQFFAIDADTGKTIWRSEGRLGENAAILNTGKFLLVLTNDATLSVVPTNADSYAPVAKYTVATSPTWAHPVATGTRILVKDETTLASLALN